MQRFDRRILAKSDLAGAAQEADEWMCNDKQLLWFAL